MGKTLADRAAIVTGAGRGLGLAIATELAREGASIAVLELDEVASEEAAQALSELGVPSASYPTDVSIGEEVSAAFEAVARDFGRIDIVVNNAGISRIGKATHEVSDKDWLESIAVMQTGTFFCMRAAGQAMIPQHSGCVINVSSIRGFSPISGRITYGVPKAAVLMMTRIAASEWGPLGIRVNAIAPGFVRTRMHEEQVQQGIFDEEQYLNVIPARRFGTPTEIGRLVAFLCSDDAAYITGACFTIDGGLTTVPAG